MELRHLVTLGHLLMTRGDEDVCDFSPRTCPELGQRSLPRNKFLFMSFLFKRRKKLGMSWLALLSVLAPFSEYPRGLQSPLWLNSQALLVLYFLNILYIYLNVLFLLVLFIFPSSKIIFSDNFWDNIFNRISVHYRYTYTRQSAKRNLWESNKN